MKNVLKALDKREKVKILYHGKVKGTIITHEVPQMESVVVSGATIQKDMAKLDIIGVINEPGNAAKVFAHLAKAQV